MIIGVGIDIVDNKRIAKLITNFGDHFLKKIFTTNEISLANQKNHPLTKINYYSKRFAAKEAFSKATGLGIGRGINFADIEIINNTNGKPKIKLTNQIKEFLQKELNCGNFKIDLSMTDEKEISQAIVIISKI